MGFPMAFLTETNLTARAAAEPGRLGRWLTAYIDRLSRRDQVGALMALTDAQLAARGLTRDGIVAYVFRDRMGI